MKFKVLVLEESENKYMGKAGQVKQWRASCRDMSEGVRCQNNFVYTLTDEEVDKYKGKLRDQQIFVNVKNMFMGNNGEIRLEGSLEPLPTGKA